MFWAEVEIRVVSGHLGSELLRDQGGFRAKNSEREFLAARLHQRLREKAAEGNRGGSTAVVQVSYVCTLSRMTLHDRGSGAVRTGCTNICARTVHTRLCAQSARICTRAHVAQFAAQVARR